VTSIGSPLLHVILGMGPFIIFSEI